MKTLPTRQAQRLQTFLDFTRSRFSASAARQQQLTGEKQAQQLFILSVIVAAGALLLTLGYLLTQNPLTLLATICLLILCIVLLLVNRRTLAIAAHKQWEERGENETIFQSLLSSIPVILSVVDRDGIITLVEGSSLPALGINPGEFTGRRFSDLYRNQPEMLGDFQRALHGEVFFSSAEIAGMMFDVWYSPLRTTSNAITGIIAVAMDVTERKLAEDLLQYQASLLQSVSDAIITVSMDLHIQSWNEAAEKMYGWQMDEVMDQRLSHILSDGSFQNVITVLQSDVLKNGTWHGDAEQQRQDGTQINVHISASLLQDDEGKPTGIILVNSDITERKRLEEQALELTLERERVRLLREFIGDISHDFRTPLTTIQTSAYLLRKKYPDVAHDHLDMVEIQAKHLANMVEDLLTLSRLDSHSQYRFEVVSANDLVSNIVQLLSAVAQQSRHHLHFEPSDQPVFISGDVTELNRAITNIIINAINYTLPNGEIAVSVRATDGGVAITVSDTGIGIPAEELPRIFERFYKVDKARSPQKGGTGLGLAITRKIVEVHAGHISVESTPDEGSTFTIWLPLVVTPLAV